MTQDTETINGHSYLVTRDGNNNIISQVAADSLPSLQAIFTKYGFRSLFSLAEQMNIDSYATNSNLTDAQKATLRTLQYDLSIADSVQLTDPITVQGVNLLEQYGLIAAGRAAQVLAGQAPPSS